MLHLGANFNQIHKTLWKMVNQGLRSAIFLILLVLGAIPLTLFALLTWKVEMKTTGENRKSTPSQQPHLSNNLSPYQRGSDSINARATSTGTGLRK